MPNATQISNVMLKALKKISTDYQVPVTEVRVRMFLGSEGSKLKYKIFPGTMVPKEISLSGLIGMMYGMMAGGTLLEVLNKQARAIGADPKSTLLEIKTEDSSTVVVAVYHLQEIRKKVLITDLI